MLDKKYRLTKNKEFETVMTQAKAVYSHVLMLKFAENDLNYTRFGIIVSNKVSKKASLRNLIKRRIREIIRLNIPAIKKGLDIVIVTSPKIIKNEKVLEYKDIEQYILTGLNKAKLI